MTPQWRFANVVGGHGRASHDAAVPGTFTSTAGPAAGVGRGRISRMAHDPACELAHGHGAVDGQAPALAVVFASAVAEHLVHFAHHLGWRCVLVEPEPQRVDDRLRAACAEVIRDARDVDGSDVVVSDHDRPELGTVLRDALGTSARWVGVMGSPRHPAPHVPALRDLGVSDDDIARVHRPVGLDIGSRTPAEIALSTLAGLVADRNGRPGGFTFDQRAGPRR